MSADFFPGGQHNIHISCQRLPRSVHHSIQKTCAAAFVVKPLAGDPVVQKMGPLPLVGNGCADHYPCCLQFFRTAAGVDHQTVPVGGFVAQNAVQMGWCGGHYTGDGFVFPPQQNVGCRQDLSVQTADVDYRNKAAVVYSPDHHADFIQMGIQQNPAGVFLSASAHQNQIPYRIGVDFIEAFSCQSAHGIMSVLFIPGHGHGVAQNF